MATVAKWKTCDVKQAAFLIYAGFSILNMGAENGRAFFEFEDSERRKTTLLSFWNREQRVEPLTFIDSINRARDMVTQVLKS